MSLIAAANSDGNGGVEKNLCRSAILLVIAASSDDNAGLDKG